MKAQMKEQKIRCRFITSTEPLDSVLHLVEVRFDDRVVYWNAVAELTDDAAKPLDPHFDGPLSMYPIAVHLEDGRKGRLYINKGVGSAGYIGVSGVGWPD